jgi:hypothetical protein
MGPSIDTDFVMKIRITNKVSHSQSDLQLEELLRLHSHLNLKQKAVQKVMTPRRSHKVRIEVLRGGHYRPPLSLRATTTKAQKEAPPPRPLILCTFTRLNPFKYIHNRSKQRWHHGPSSNSRCQSLGSPFFRLQ